MEKMNDVGIRLEYEEKIRKAIGAFMKYNNLSECLHYWSDSGLTPIYRFDGTAEELEMLKMPEEEEYFICRSKLPNNEIRWSVCFEMEILSCEITFTCFHIVLTSELEAEGLEI